MRWGISGACGSVATEEGVAGGSDGGGWGEVTLGTLAAVVGVVGVVVVGVVAVAAVRRGQVHPGELESENDELDEADPRQTQPETDMTTEVGQQVHDLQANIQLAEGADPDSCRPFRTHFETKNQLNPRSSCDGCPHLFVDMNS